MRLAQASEEYKDAMDSLRFYSVRRTEWARVVSAIEHYVDILQGDLGLQEPGT